MWAFELCEMSAARGLLDFRFMCLSCSLSFFTNEKLPIFADKVFVLKDTLVIFVSKFVEVVHIELKVRKEDF